MGAKLTLRRRMERNRAESLGRDVASKHNNAHSFEEHGGRIWELKKIYTNKEKEISDSA